MRVPQQDHIYAGYFFSNRDGFVLVRDLTGRQLARAQVGFETHVHRDDDQINFLFVAQDGDPLLRFADRFAEL